VHQGYLVDDPVEAGASVDLGFLGVSGAAVEPPAVPVEVLAQPALWPVERQPVGEILVAEPADLCLQQHAPRRDQVGPQVPQAAQHPTAADEQRCAEARQDHMGAAVM